ncbi:hypothetical protein PVAP13_9KG298500 [Panicum virgatum]|uniref:DUF7769 domain-containing protein n=1 Tax=Panicum virgatum TaxID=38727 RepID=A0A8T0NVF0_PANVG|nr:hypothetical protein PVAP13_9KG298500 [Panicum virgatum]
MCDLAGGFNLNVRLEEDDNNNAAFDLNQPIDDNNDVDEVHLDEPDDDVGGVDEVDHDGVDDDGVYEDDNDYVDAPVQVNQRRKEVPEDVRKQVYQALLTRSNSGILHKKYTQIVADQFDLHLRTVQRIWRRGKTQLADNVPVVVSSLKKGRVGRKAIPIDLEALRAIPLKDRMTI